MPSFDSARDCHIVRVVYDGPGLAGKTTNLKQLCRLVSARKRSELYTPAELKGRTMFFDWLEVDAPPQKNGQLKVQLITVPGQYQRNYRRRPLVEMADVVVFVCDSTQLPDTLRTFARLRASMKRRKTPLPIVVQANKMDAPGAMPLERLRRRLRLEEGVPMIAATALRGPGVRETLATAIRLGIGMLSGTILPLSEIYANADKLFDHVLTFEDNPHDDEPIDAEELNVTVEEMDVEPAAKAGRLAAASLDALEARARRAASKAETASAAAPEPQSVPAAESKPAAAPPAPSRATSQKPVVAPSDGATRKEDAKTSQPQTTDELVEVSRSAKHSKDSVRGKQLKG